MPDGLYPSRTVSQQDISPDVLIVEDERPLAELYAECLESDYTVRTAYTGEQALEGLELDPDVVLLDRQLPDATGDDIVRVIQERKIDTRIAMVTAVDPDFDIIDMGIDDYLIKPVDGQDLEETVEKLLAADDLQAKKRELSAKQVKRNVLAVEKSPEALAVSEDFSRLEARIDKLESEIATLEPAATEGGDVAMKAEGD